MLHSPIYLYIKEVTLTESRVIQASDNFHEMIGLSSAEMIGKTMEELFPADFAAKMTADDWAVIRNGKVLRLDEDLNGRNYTTIKFPIAIKDKRLLAGYTIDITERKRSEAEVLLAKTSLQATLDAIPDLLFEVGLSGRIYNYHSRDSANLAAPAEEFIGKYFIDIIPPEAASVCKSALYEALATGCSTGKEYVLQLPHGEHWFDISVAPLPEQDEFTEDRHFIFLARDITERKHAEEKLELAASVSRMPVKASALPIQMD